ncbi:hypothetical protein L7F22_036932 [Adiantum nelumboides]|nr:hypothetical protein [Adiantum nelumboides]
MESELHLETASTGTNVKSGRMWFLIADCLLRYSNAQQFIWQLVNSESVLHSLSTSSTEQASSIRSNVITKADEKSLEALENLLWQIMESWPIESLCSSEWFNLASWLMEVSSAERFVSWLAGSEELLQSLKTLEDFEDIFSYVLQSIDKKVILLSNLQRSRLVRWLLQCTSTWTTATPPSHIDTILKLANMLPFSEKTAIMCATKNHSQDLMLMGIGRIFHDFIEMDETSLNAALGSENLQCDIQAFNG